MGRGSRLKDFRGGWRLLRLQRGSNRRGHACRRYAASEQVIPIRWRRRNIPDIRGGFQLDADLKEFARICWRMDRLHQGANNRRDGLAVGLEHAKADGRPDWIFMARWIAAAVKIETDRGCFFLEGQAGNGLSEHDERNGAVDARAAAAFPAGKRMQLLWGSD